MKIQYIDWLEMHSLYRKQYAFFRYTYISIVTLIMINFLDFITPNILRASFM